MSAGPQVNCRLTDWSTFWKEAIQNMTTIPPDFAKMFFIGNLAQGLKEVPIVAIKPNFSSGALLEIADCSTSYRF